MSIQLGKLAGLAWLGWLKVHSGVPMMYYCCTEKRKTGHTDDKKKHTGVD